MCLLGLGLGDRPRVVRMSWQYPDRQVDGDHADGVDIEPIPILDINSRLVNLDTSNGQEKKPSCAESSSVLVGDIGINVAPRRDAAGAYTLTSTCLSCMQYIS